MISESQSFEGQLAQFAEKTKERLDDVIKRTALEMLRSVIFMSPVADPESWKQPRKHVGGKFRRNWQVSLGGPASGVLEIEDPTGGDAFSKGAEAIAAGEPDQSIWIVNNVPYARRLEYGWSQQAPTGMVAVSVSRFQTFINQVLADQPATLAPIVRASPARFKK